MLPLAYQLIYESFYADYASSKTLTRKLARKLESWYHRKVAALGTATNPTILEIGSGSSNHVPYETNFVSYDVVEPKKYLFDSTPVSISPSIRHHFSDISDVNCSQLYNKIVSLACLEHITDLDGHLLAVRSHLSEGGSFIVAIPAEGEFLWWITWRLTTGIAFWLKYKLDYGIIMRHEHVNTARSVSFCISKYFRIKSTYSFPTSIRHCRLYIILECHHLPSHEP